MISNHGEGVSDYKSNLVNKVIKYPVTILERNKIEEMISDHGVIKLRIMEDKNAYTSKTKSYDMYGYLIKNKNY